MLKRTLALILVLLLLFSAVPLALAESPQYECDPSASHYARAVQLHDMGDYDRALRHYHCALQGDPDNTIIPQLIENVHEDIANVAQARSSAAQTDEASAPANPDPPGIRLPDWLKPDEPPPPAHPIILLSEHRLMLRQVEQTLLLSDGDTVILWHQFQRLSIEEHKLLISDGKTTLLFYSRRVSLITISVLSRAQLAMP